jgi:hypothetical protein
MAANPPLLMRAHDRKVSFCLNVNHVLEFGKFVSYLVLRQLLELLGHSVLFLIGYLQTHSPVIP